MKKIEPGVYRHYKGHEYDVYGEAILSGTEDGKQILFVIYRPRYGERRITCRPKDTFEGEVQSAEYRHNGPRFVFVKELESPELKVIVDFFSS